MAFGKQQQLYATPDQSGRQEEHDPTKSPDGTLPNRAANEETSQVLSYPEGGARAWSVAAGAAGILFCTLGYTNAFGVYQEYYQLHQLHDLSPSTISWIGSLQVLFLLGGALFGGSLFDRFGGMAVWPAAAAYVSAVMLTSICRSYYQFVLAQAVLGGLSGGMTMAPSLAATGQYFHKNRGAAMGIAICGSSLGGVVFPIALGKMLNNPRLTFGWTVRICGFIMLTVLAVSCTGVRARLPPRKGQLFLPSAFKEVPYVALIAAGFLVMLGFFIPFFYLPSYAVQHGMSTKLASYLVAILNGASFFGRIIPGILADKLGRFNMFFTVVLCSGVLILCWRKTTTNSSIIVFSALYGFSSGAVISLMTVCLAHVPRDPRNIGTYMGMGMAVVSLAALVGPPINGALITHYGGFDQVSIFSGVMVLAGGFTILLAKHAIGEGLCAKN